MGINVIPETTFTKNELSLIEEAVRRAASLPANAGADRARIAEAVRAEVRRGTRDLFGLVKAGARAGAA